MSYMKLKSQFLFLMMGSTLLFSAGLGEKKFDVETGMVMYDISGGGVLAEDVNISIKGEGKLRFRDWGVEALIEEDYVELTSGRLHDIYKVKRCEKLEDKQRLDVDFKTEKIMERPMPKGNFKEYFLKDMSKTGEDTIAGYRCEVWEGNGVKKCLYKGIPLLIEYYILGVYYQKKALEARLDIETNPSKCTLPDFPIEKFALFKTNIKTESVKLPQDLPSLIRRVRKELNQSLKDNNLNIDDLNPKQKRVVLDKLGENVFEKQKTYLPKLLDSMKKARACLQQAEHLDNANACLAEIRDMEGRVNKDEDYDILSWDDKHRNKVLDYFDDSIFLLQSNMKCIRGAQNISDLSHCMK